MYSNGTRHLIGTQIGKYVIKSFVDEGVSCCAYRATDKIAGREVLLVITTIQAHRDPDLVPLLKDRVKRVKNLGHPNLARPRTVGTTADGHLYLVSDPLPGKSLAEHMATLRSDQRTMPVAEALQLIRTLAGALTIAHLMNLYHAALRPDFIFLRPDGTPVILGLELPDLLPPSDAAPRSQRTEIISSYVAPEVLDGGGEDAASNVYSLGVILYELLAGQSPIGQAAAQVKSTLNGDAAPLRFAGAIRPSTRKLLSDCLAIDPAGRPRSMTSLAYHLDAAISVERQGQPRSKRLRRDRIRFSLAIFGTLLFVVVVILTLFGRQRLGGDSGPDPEPTTAAVADQEADPVVGEPLEPTVPAVVIADPTPTAIPTASPEENAADEPPLTASGATGACPDGAVLVPAGEFCLDVHEVTNQDYGDCVSAGACDQPQFRRSLTHDEYFGNVMYADFPVIQVTWQQAGAYCRYVGGRLPTAAEWDLAAALVPDPPSLAEWSSFSDTYAVGTNPQDQTESGLVDLWGNVREWTADAEGVNRLVRGGGFASTSAEIGRYLETVSDWSIGFRCAANPSR